LVGSYIFGGPNSLIFADLSPLDRTEFALAQGEQLHPEYRDFMTRGVSRAWSKVPYSMGSWSTSDPPPVLQVPDGPFIFGGEHTTYLGGWQEGAVLSAHGALLQLQDLLA
jgi:monoamine oxidase